MRRFVQLAQTAGLSIAEIRQLLNQSRDGRAPRNLWKHIARSKRDEVRRQIRDLTVDRILTELLECKCESVERCVSSACGTLNKAGA